MSIESQVETTRKDYPRITALQQQIRIVIRSKTCRCWSHRLVETYLKNKNNKLTKCKDFRRNTLRIHSWTVTEKAQFSLLFRKTKEILIQLISRISHSFTLHWIPNIRIRHHCILFWLQVNIPMLTPLRRCSQLIFSRTIPKSFEREN